MNFKIEDCFERPGRSLSRRGRGWTGIAGVVGKVACKTEAMDVHTRAVA